MGKLEKQYEALRNKDKGPSKSEIAQNKLINTQEDYIRSQGKSISVLNEAIVELQKNINQINSALKGISITVSEIELDVDLSGVYGGIGEVGQLVSEVNKSVAGIDTDVDLSGIESLIKKIKPTDLTKLNQKLDNLLTSRQAIEMPEEMDMDLTPIINEMNKPKTVEFDVVTNSHGFPLKVIAKEQVAS